MVSIVVITTNRGLSSPFRRMRMFKKLVSTSNDVSLTVLRLVLGVVFFAHGAQKVLGWFGGYGYAGTMEFFTHRGMPVVITWLVMAIELLGGLGLVVGFLTRIAALGVACDMIGAIFLVHLPNGFFMNWAGNQKGEGYECHLLVLAVAAALLLPGTGKFWVDPGQPW